MKKKEGKISARIYKERNEFFFPLSFMLPFSSIL
jgi:hypothetical protein